MTCTNLSDAQIEAIKKEANEQIHKKFPMLGNNTVESIHIKYVLAAYEKIIKK